MARKVGEGHLKAFVRQGLDELRNAVYSESNVVDKHTPYGIYGTRTPGEVADERRDDNRSDDVGETKSSSVIDDRLQQAQSRDDRDEPPRDMERD